MEPLTHTMATLTHIVDISYSSKTCVGCVSRPAARTPRSRARCWVKDLNMFSGMLFDSFGVPDLGSRIFKQGDLKQAGGCTQRQNRLYQKLEHARKGEQPLQRTQPLSQIPTPSSSSAIIRHCRRRRETGDSTMQLASGRDERARRLSDQILEASMASRPKT